MVDTATSDQPGAAAESGSPLDAAVDLALSAGRLATFEFDAAARRVRWSRGLTDVLSLDGDRAAVELRLTELLDPVVAATTTAPAPWADYAVEQQVDGRWLRVHVRRSTPARYVGAIVDITEQHEYYQELDDLVDRYRLLVELSPDGIVVHHQGIVVYANPAAVRFVGAPAPDHVEGSPITDFVHADSRPAMMARIASLSAAGMVSEPAEATLLRRDGGTLTVESTSVRTTWHGSPAYQVIMRDVSERRAVENALRYQAALVSNVSDGIVAVDPEGIVTSWNPAAETIYGWPVEDVLGRSVDTIFEAELPADGTRAELAHQRRDGTPVDVAVSVARLVDAAGTIAGSVIVCSDITERKLAAATLWHEARHDGLTGLANRILVLERLDAVLSSLHETGPAVAVLFLDIDHFKVVNDSLGHGAGDDVLRVVAERLTTTVRDGDMVARLGGDEFVVVSCGHDGLTSVDRLAARLRAAVAEPIQLGDRRVVVHVSAGIVMVSGAAVPGAEEVLRDADVAMYQAKSHGRDRHEVFDADLRRRAVRRLELEEQLRGALHSDQIWLAFQPVISMHTDRVVATEALLRWTSPVFGTVTPGEFVPIAEESGLIVALGTRVLELACKQTADWRAAHSELADLHVSVNLSARQLADPALVHTVATTLAAAGLPASALRLEITESMLMVDAEAAAHTLARLGELGVRLSIDDFGTGYSSLAYLTRFQVHELKIDRSFVDGMGRDKSDAIIVASVVALAHTLGLDVVAEGVETAEQLDVLRSLSCDAAQGYHLGRPAGPADVLPHLLESARTLA
jgi:diguanylate cyclase (GGDEF)-like protein/PAS domain S-box-containing protein